MNIVILIMSVMFGVMFFIEPFIDHRRLLFSQSVRMRIFHTSFTIRIWVFSFFQQQRLNISSEYKALEEIVRLHYPPFYIRDKANYTELLQFRSIAKQIFIGLYPKRDIQTCKIEPITFKYNSQQVHAYSIRNGNMNDWSNDNQKFILYIHGGSFVYGDIEIYSGYECYLSQEYHMPVIHIEYRLAPEHFVHCAIDDIVTVYMSMLKINPTISRRMIGMGDASGGLLWIRLIQIIVQQELPIPCSLILFSPLIDFNFRDISSDFFTKQKRPLFSLRLLINLRQRAFSTLEYTEESKFVDKLTKQIYEINPVEYSFKGFPPLYITAGTEEVFIWDAYDLKTEIEANNGQIIVEEGYGLMHTYSMFHLWSPEARRSQRNIRKFIEQFL